MYWTLELASKLEDAPWPATKDELIDYAVRSGAPLEVLENLQEIEDEGEIYESIGEITIYLVYYVNDESVPRSTGIRVNIADWDKVKGRVRLKNPNAGRFQ